MKTTKSCCRIFPVILFAVSVVVTMAIWYFDEGNHSFSFLTEKNELFSFFGWMMFIFALPVGIFYLASEKEKLKNRAKLLALLGFLPELIFLVSMTL